MENLEFEFRAERPVAQRAHVGVVGSGDLEVLLEPAADCARVRVCTSVDGYGEIWRRVLQRFFERHPVAASLRINDFGATPGVVALRLEQALEASRP
ncbi:MAG: malonate decarboxylase subunit delta [Betaproteobacteria bacterium]|nr:malonate decarboxylase subunit delta [Betaproteobacteria bacterium]MBU6513278.1 malonate decarboxylase subunit delta [Betaproteobacteria bacterium]MDE1956444.1 malonate decarboxylase subunit delta [Betaproteobacteria bacterium]MDE2153083.1 malonate decarboxylase subunit delta [Betaproteobacteria bacterium]